MPVFWNLEVMRKGAQGASRLLAARELPDLVLVALFEGHQGLLELLLLGGRGGLLLEQLLADIGDLPWERERGSSGMCYCVGTGKRGPRFGTALWSSAILASFSASLPWISSTMRCCASRILACCSASVTLPDRSALS